MSEKQTGLAVRQDFSGLETVRPAETAAAALGAQAKAMVEARYIMAIQRPRNWDQVRQDVLKECKRPEFAANKSVWYKKPVGGGNTAEGLGIRWVEVALRCMRNVLIESAIVFEDQEKEIHRVTVTDLEANVTYPLDVKVAKTVERSRPDSDGGYISVRMNSRGQHTYTLPAREDDLLNKRGAAISKAVRVLGLRIIPGDLQEEAAAMVSRVRESEVKADPDKVRKAIADSFAEIGVRADDLAAYLGHSLESCSPSELSGLRGIYGAIRDGETSWQSVLENAEEGAKRGNGQQRKEQTRETSGGPGGQTGSVRDKVVRNTDPAAGEQAQKPASDAAADSGVSGGPDNQQGDVSHAVGEWPQKGADGVWVDSRGFRFHKDAYGVSENGKPAVSKKTGRFAKKRGGDLSFYQQHEKAEAERVARGAGGFGDTEQHESNGATPGAETEPGLPASDDAKQGDTDQGGMVTDYPTVSSAIARAASMEACDDAEDLLRHFVGRDDLRQELQNLLIVRRDRLRKLLGE